MSSQLYRKQTRVGNRRERARPEQLLQNQGTTGQRWRRVSSTNSQTFSTLITVSKKYNNQVRKDFRFHNERLSHVVVSQMSTNPETSTRIVSSRSLTVEKHTTRWNRHLSPGFATQPTDQNAFTGGTSEKFPPLQFTHKILRWRNLGPTTRCAQKQKMLMGTAPRNLKRLELAHT